MNAEEVHKVFMKAFSLLGSKEIENMRWHLKNETPVFTGFEATRWYANPVSGAG